MRGPVLQFLDIYLSHTYGADIISSHIDLTIPDIKIWNIDFFLNWHCSMVLYAAWIPYVWLPKKNIQKEWKMKHNSIYRSNYIQTTFYIKDFTKI